MLTLHVIDRHFWAHRYDALLEAIVLNGLEIPLPVRARLSQTPASAVALALRRVLDLTYGPTTLSREMVRFLLDQQAEDGSFNADPLATATVVAALVRWTQETGSTSAAIDGTTGSGVVGAAQQRAMDWLATHQDEDGLFRHADDRTQDDRAATAAYVLSILADDEAFRSAVRWADLLNWFEARFDELDESTHRLLSLARTGHLPPTRRSAAVAAIAA